MGVSVPVVTLIRGVEQAFYRFASNDGGVAYSAAERAYLALFEAVNWVHAIDDRLQQDWLGTLRQRERWYDAFDAGRTARGARFAHPRSPPVGRRDRGQPDRVIHGVAGGIGARSSQPAEQSLTLTGTSPSTVADGGAGLASCRRAGAIRRGRPPIENGSRDASSGRHSTTSQCCSQASPRPLRTLMRSCRACGPPTFPDA
jgi:hypothetical protein